MDLRHYRSFIALAEEKSFTAAARKLNIVQSGLSATIKELEEELGVRLVNRTTRRVSLTNAGLLFLEYARPGLTMLTDGLEAVRSESQVVRGRLNLGILQSLGPYIDLPIVLKEFHEQYPKVDFAVRSVDSMRAPELVRAGDLDLSFHAQITEGVPAGVEIIPFVQDTLVAVCASSHSLAGRKSLSLQALSDLQFVDLTPERALRNLIDKALASHRIVRECVYEVNSVATMMQFVSAGLGIAVVPNALALACASALKLQILTFDDQKSKMPKWRLVLLARPLRQRHSGRTLPELMLHALSRAKRTSRRGIPQQVSDGINHLC